MAWADALVTSRRLIEHLLNSSSAGLSPTQRINSLNLLHPSDDQRKKLERFLRNAATQPLLEALGALAQQPELWVNSLRLESTAESVQSIELRLWRTAGGRIAKWSGLTEDSEKMSQSASVYYGSTGHQQQRVLQLKVQWKAHPNTL